MNREINGQLPHFRTEKRQTNPYRLLILVCMILGGVWLLLKMESGQVKPLFLPTPTPTRTANSYILEGEAQFKAGAIEGAIAAYQEAVQIDPLNGKVWAELARIQTYSSSLLSTDAERYERMQAARDSIDQAIAAQPDDADAYAIRALVMHWFAASPLLNDVERQAALNDAEAAAVRALQLDSEHAQTERQLDELRAARDAALARANAATEGAPSALAAANAELQRTLQQANQVKGLFDAESLGDQLAGADDGTVMV